jgi:hypothetical protein
MTMRQSVRGGRVYLHHRGLDPPTPPGLSPKGAPILDGPTFRRMPALQFVSLFLGNGQAGGGVMLQLDPAERRSHLQQLDRLRAHVTAAGYDASDVEVPLDAVEFYRASRSSSL